MSLDGFEHRMVAAGDVESHGVIAGCALWLPEERLAETLAAFQDFLAAAQKKSRPHGR